jgi:hypothetical protein
MIRTQVQLTENQARTLRAMAAEQNKSVAELIRQSVDDLIRRSASVDMAERRRRAIAAAGRFRSGQTDIAERHDDYLDETYAS